MAYKLKEVTIRTNNSKEGMKKIGEIWGDIVSGKLPILFDSEHIFQQGFLQFQNTVTIPVMKVEIMTLR